MAIYPWISHYYTHDYMIYPYYIHLIQRCRCPGHPLRWHRGDLGPPQLRWQLSQGAGATAGGVPHLPRQRAAVPWSVQRTGWAGWGVGPKVMGVEILGEFYGMMLNYMGYEWDIDGIEIDWKRFDKLVCGMTGSRNLFFWTNGHNIHTHKAGSRNDGVLDGEARKLPCKHWI